MNLIVLAIETATIVCSSALAKADELLAEVSLCTGRNHSERLMPSVRELLNLAGLNLEQVGAIAVSMGPGSFTGLRIGLATAKSLAYALNIPIVGVPTLEALAYQLAGSDSLIVPLMDAQKKRFYTGFYEWQQKELREVKQTEILDLENLKQQLAEVNRPVILLGEGAKLYGQEICEELSHCQVAQPYQVLPRAATIAMAAMKRLEQNRTDDVMTLAPLYLRQSEAEIMWEKKRGLKS